MTIHTSSRVLPINGQRYWDRLIEIGEISDPAQPWTRRSFSDRFLQGRGWLRRQFEAAGLAVRVDAAGNLIGRVEGTQGSGVAQGCIMVGSHSDTVPGGGRFDGVAGVLAGLEIAASLQERGERLNHALEVVDFLAEEPSEFGLSCIGSRGMAAELKPNVLQYTNPAGETLAAAIHRMGGSPERLDEAARRDIAAFFELHIEQGVVLETKNLDLGMVTAIVGITRLAVTFTGQAGHAGTTPMDLRQDAMTAAADFIVRLRDMASDFAERRLGYFVATAGTVTVTPNAANVVPGRVTMLLDLRSDNRLRMDEFLGVLKPLAEVAAQTNRVALTQFERVSDTSPAYCDHGLIAHLQASADALGYSYQDLTSGAGHDCAFVSHVAPSAMLFVPSRDGKSHCPEEWTEPAQIVAGVATLYEAVRRFDAASEGPVGVPAPSNKEHF